MHRSCPLECEQRQFSDLFNHVLVLSSGQLYRAQLARNAHMSSEKKRKRKKKERKKEERERERERERKRPKTDI